MKMLRDLLAVVRRRLDLLGFRSSEEYWIRRYRRGGDSGFGSHGPLGRYKAAVLNRFVNENGINTVIEFGCGDGNQLTLAKYPRYVGYDISPDAIALCRRLFRDDSTKAFHLVSEYAGDKADLALSLDVIYHLVEDAAFEKHMRLLLDASREFVIIYSTDAEHTPVEDPHIRHRRFTEWMKAKAPAWELISHLPSDHLDARRGRRGFSAEFFMYRRAPNSD
jgi:SAM-dependent methyltransferase